MHSREALEQPYTAYILIYQCNEKVDIKP